MINEMKVLVTLIFTLVVINITNGSVVTLNERVKLVDLNGSQNDFFAMAVTINNDTIIVGSQYADVDGKRDPGSIAIYSVNGNAVKLKTTLSPTTADSYFGYSVATNGHYIIVGSVGDDKPIANQGAVYIYNYNGKAWVYKRIVADDGASDDFFGMSVAISESNEIVVGAGRGDGIGGQDSGSVYVFKKNGSEWTQTQKLVPAGLTPDCRFGRSVAVTNTHIVVGAYSQKNNNQLRSGGMYIYKKDVTWLLQTKVTSPNTEINGRFGWSVSIYGSRIVTGCRGEEAYRGNVYVYVTDGNTWKLEEKLTVSDKKAFDFGSQVSIYKDTIVAGAYRTPLAVGVGSAYVFQRVGGKWQEINKLVAKDGTAGDCFGWAVGIFNGKVIVGSPQQARANGTKMGLAYVFTGLNFTTAKTKTTQQPPASTTPASTTPASTTPATCRAVGMAGSPVLYTSWFVAVFCFFYTTF